MALSIPALKYGDFRAFFIKNLLVRNIASGVLKYDHKNFEATRNATTSVKSISSDGQKLSYTTGKDKSNLFVNKSLNTGESKI